MRYMVERWLRGKRIGCGVVVQQTLSQYTFTSGTFGALFSPIFIKKILLKENLFIVCFTLGKHPLVPSTRVPTDEMRSGLSQSPPTLEKPRQPRPPYSELTQFPRCVTFYCQFSSLFALAPQN